MTHATQLRQIRLLLLDSGGDWGGAGIGTLNDD